jgi:hypothetical protein
VHPPESDPKDPAQPNRFNAVIEKIERLYMGKHSSDEEDLDDVPDDDQYDTEDSFIDDAELVSISKHIQISCQYASNNSGAILCFSFFSLFSDCLSVHFFSFC